MDAVRIKVRLNGAATGVALKITPETTSKAQLVAAALVKLDMSEFMCANAEAVKLYDQDGDQADVADLEKDDVVYLALHGSPFKDKKPRTDEGPGIIDATVLPQSLQVPAVPKKPRPIARKGAHGSLK